MLKSTPRNIDKSKSSSIKKQPLHVVAIGASAGGMDPLLSFFKNMPSDTGMAFIIVQHLSSDFKSLMGEILVHSTSMPIHTVEEGMPIESNTIYLLPPNHTMTIKKGHFHLALKNIDEQIHYPIDILFDSLATAYKKRAIAVILSGAGTDGSLGVVKIAEAGGLVLVESTHEAQFIGMPQSAIATEVVDYIAPVNELPEIIMQYANDPLAAKPTFSEHDLHYSPEHEQLFKLLHSHYNIDFSHYKLSTIFRRIDRRIQTLKLHTIQAYLEYLQIQPEELALLYKDLLIGVTLFFRDQAAFALLEENVIPKLFEKQQHTQEDIRVWCAACSTGEEAYSLAILFFEYAEKNNLPLNIKIFATDISVDLMNVASIGIYSKDAVQYISQKRLERYFTLEGEQYKVMPIIRDMIIFVPHNLLTSPPFIKMDLISCRNFLIYVQPLIQKKILSLLHLGLNPNGFLFLGPSENIGELTPFVEAISSTWKIYKKTNPLPTHLLFNQHGSPTFSNPTNQIPSIKRLTVGPVTSYIMPKGNGSSLPIYAYQALIKQFIPCGFILDEYFNVLHILGNAGDYISHDEGVAKLDILSMISNKLKMPLSEALHRTKKNKTAITYANIAIINNKGENTQINLNVQPITENHHVFYYCVRFEPADAKFHQSIIEQYNPNDGSLALIHNLEYELQQTTETLQHTIQALETTNEELLASNEELQSTNEELQSVNEVLYSVNTEHQKKILELREANTNIDNLLRSTEIGSVFVNKSLKIRMFTPVIARFFDLVKSDIGRSLTSFIFRADFTNLIEKIKWVIKNEKAFETEIKDEHGQWNLLRILPYLNEEKIIDGAIVTLIDINEIKTSQVKLKEADAKLNQALQKNHLSVYRWDFEKNIIEHDNNLSKLFGITDNKTLQDYAQFEACVIPEDREYISTALTKTMTTEELEYSLEFRIIWPDKSLHYIATRGQVHRTATGIKRYMTGVCWDITEHTTLDELLARRKNAK